MKWKMNSFRCLQWISLIRPVADRIIRIQVYMVDTAIIGSHGCDHTVQLLTFLFLLQ